MIDGRSNRPTPTGSGDKTRSDFWPDLSDSTAKSKTVAAKVESEPAATPEPNELVAEVPTEPEKPIEREVDETIELDDTPNDLSDVKKARIWPWQRFTTWFKGLDKKKKALVIVAFLLVIFGLSAGTFALLQSEEPPKSAPKQVVEEVEPEPTTIANTLTGRQVEPEINNRQVTAVIVENSSAARPQAGLQKAGVVFEAIAEGGVTRFMALYQDTDPESIGPVRSLRPYYLSWAQGFDAAVAHVGGSPEALQQVRERGTKDLDQSFNAAFFQRVTDRYAPHNVFTDINQLRTLQTQKGYTSSTFEGFDRLDEGKPAATPTARTVQVNISSANYNSAYTYNAETNQYARTMAGSPHTDKVTKAQIAPDVVVVMVMNYSINSNGIHSIYNTVGSGKIFVFQNGVAAEGTWEKTAHTSNISFTDAAGEPLKLNPGQTWISAVSSADKVGYQP